MPLPEERLPFPVVVPFRIRPDLRRWSDGDRGHLRLDARYPSYLEAKLRLLADDARGCRVVAEAAEPAALRGALVRTAQAFAEEAPAGDGVRPVVVDEGGVRFPLLGAALDRERLTLSETRAATGVGGEPVVPRALAERARAHLAAVPPLERLADALALAVQEDLAIMRGAGRPAPTGDARPGYAELLHVCFPSGWDPAARAGADFATLHAPVPHAEPLERAAPQLMRAMVSKGPFVRYVWSLAADGSLDRNPRRRPGARGPGAVPPRSLWFRVERQTVLAMPELRRALFTIRVSVAPLTNVVTEPERRRRLAAAIASMDEAMLRYKGIGEGRQALLDWLGADGDGGATAS